MKFLTILLAMISMTALGAEIELLEGSVEKIDGHAGVIPDTWLPRIVLEGEITPGDDIRFSEVLGKAEEIGKDWELYGSLRLNSGGGDVATAMSIGRLVRAAQISTIVQANETCASACTLILAGGSHRIAWRGARIGLHRPYFADPKLATEGGYYDFQNAYESVLEAHRAYFTEMRIGSEILERMLKIPSNDVEWIDHGTASNLNLLGVDAVYAEWRRARRIARIGRKCVEWEDRHGACLAQLGFPADGVYEKCVELTGKPEECD